MTDHLRRGIGLAAAVATVVSVAALAPAASAASNPSLVHFDTAYSAGWSCTSSSASVRMNPGDRLTLTWSSDQPSVGGFTFNGPNGQTVVNMSTSSPSQVSWTTLGTYELDSAYSFN